MIHALAAGAAGFHSAPDETGMVEIGYRVDPAMRRQGWALRSVETLLAVARRHEDVHTVRATISPTNAPSLGLIGRFAFGAVGEQWDDEDGLEIIYEMEV
ncbi:MULTISPECIES: GNAT family N-acetyltransferase [unclassified Rhodococcus (in: high G+C Gram-positive bacteria)]|uniref:GNAT family N-acetyltransferase n=1 Tax=unclassified Rhodococcus (in: high G+C Gram-positive bacteria) TaxID=192944 RepID=UPI001F3C4B38|nr:MULTISPECIES: GNAT family N-acetyltransferase [unclassified Rhodococcus (in: high G+C Gram-positive bacteria)]